MITQFVMAKECICILPFCKDKVEVILASMRNEDKPRSKAIKSHDGQDYNIVGVSDSNTWWHVGHITCNLSNFPLSYFKSLCTFPSISKGHYKGWQYAKKVRFWEERMHRWVRTLWTCCVIHYNVHCLGITNPCFLAKILSSCFWFFSVLEFSLFQNVLPRRNI